MCAQFKAKASKTQSDGTTKKEAELEVFITGSFVTENQSEVSLGKVDLPGVERTNGFTKVTQRQITDFKTHKCVFNRYVGLH